MTSIVQTTRIGEAVKNDQFWVRGTDCDLVGIIRSKALLVTFDNLGSINERPKNGPWAPWMHRRAEALNLSILGVQSHHKDWYRNQEAPDQISSLKELDFFDQFDNIVFTGASMGGFAALCFAGLVPAARVLAFSPQSTLNRDIAPFERRYPYPYRKFDWENPRYLDAAEHTDGITAGHIFFDPKILEDRLHAKRLQSPNLTQVQIPFAGHTLIRVLAKAGALDYLLESYCNTGRIDAAFFRKMRDKRLNKAWAKPFLQAAVDRGDGILARRACSFLHREYGYRFAKLQLKALRAASASQVEPREKM